MFTDLILIDLTKKYPAPNFSDKSELLYENLIGSIISQQLSLKAADTIFGRFRKLFIDYHSGPRLNRSEQSEESVSAVIPSEEGIQKKKLDSGSDSSGRDIRPRPKMTNVAFPSPLQILAMEDQKIRDAGISFQKISYIKSVADAFMSGLIVTEKIKHMTDEEVINTLTQIRGVGQWTAEMILIFTLGRPDIFSLGDLGLRNAITRLYGITDKKEMLQLAETWAPYRSTACWYLWRSLENKP